MLFKLNQVGSIKYCLDPGFTKQEIGPFGTSNHLFEELGRNMNDFYVEMSPFYDSDTDPRLRTPEMRASIVKRLQEHPKFGVEFHEYTPEEEPVTVTVGDIILKDKKIEELERVIERMQKGGKQQTAINL